MKKLIARLKVFAFAITTLAKKVFKREETKPINEDTLFV